MPCCLHAVLSPCRIVSVPCRPCAVSSPCRVVSVSCRLRAVSSPCRVVSVPVSRVPAGAPPSDRPLRVVSVYSHSSQGSVATKYGPESIKGDVAAARGRVQSLRLELDRMRTEMAFRERGVETLAQ